MKTKCGPLIQNPNNSQKLRLCPYCPKIGQMSKRADNLTTHLLSVHNIGNRSSGKRTKRKSESVSVGVLVCDSRSDNSKKIRRMYHNQPLDTVSSTSRSSSDSRVRSLDKASEVTLSNDEETTIKGMEIRDLKTQIQALKKELNETKTDEKSKQLKIKQ